VRVKLIATLLALAVAARTQTSRGTVTGTVLDATGASVTGAHLTLTGGETGARLSTQSNATGLFRFDSVDPGVYNLQVVHPGFRPYIATQVVVEANRVAAENPKLEVGPAELSIEVNAESSAVLTKDGPLRGGNFPSGQVRNLPLISLNPLSLARTLPGATEAAGSTVWGGGSINGSGGNGGGFSINGQRPRGNNFMLDGAENNEVWLTGAEQVFTIADAVEEVSVLTGNFGVEFGRAGGGVFNVVTKSGGNGLHGSLLWRYQSQRFNSVSNVDRLNGVPKTVFARNVFGLTTGGPIRKGRLFFFAAFQRDDFHSAGNFSVIVPTADAVNQLGLLFPNDPRLDLYLSALGNLRGTGAPFPVALGGDRGAVQFANAAYPLPSINDGSQGLGRVDYYQSEAHRLSWRYTADSRVVVPYLNGANKVSFPGFVTEEAFSHHSFLFADSYTFSPGYTNEFRFSYARPHGNFGTLWPGSVPLARTLEQIMLTPVSSPGEASSGQYHNGNTYLLQETQTKLVGRHALRYGVEFVRQFIAQQPIANDLGVIGFTAAGSYSAFANFLDDYSGPSGAIKRDFGAKVFHPDQFRQAYFFQDSWKAAPGLFLTLGLRYENFGQPANSVPFAAFPGFDPSQFLAPHKVHPDNNDIAPSFGLAWSPVLLPGLIGRLFGEGKTVWRGGFQISYDSQPTQLISGGPAISTPNDISVLLTAPNSARGSPNWLEQLPAIAVAPNPMNSETPIAGDFRDPYTERWAFGFQRQLRGHVVLDISYVGSESHKLTTRADWNPRLPTGTLRLYPDYGSVLATTSEGNSSYHALQASLNRRFAHGFQLSASYTWSKLIDSTSDGDGSINVQEPSNTNLTSVPVMQGGLKLDRGLSDFDRPQRLTIAYLWEVPGPKTGWYRYMLGGWQLAGITTFQSGTPFTVSNGFDRNNYGDKQDRPDIGNPNAPLPTRAILFPNCATGYQNPDNGSCVSPGDAHWVEGVGFPNASTVGRNTLRTGGTNNFDLNLTKSIPLGETTRLELRWEALNALNHPQFVNVPQKSVLSSPRGQFLNRAFTDSGIRSMWVQVKLRF
jgi:hypothetical protein